MQTTTQRGFTLTELVVAMGIVAILLAIGAPSYRYVTTTNRVSSEINGLLGDLQFARAEAIREGQTVSVCAANTSGSQCSGTESWTNGWIVFSDSPTLGTIDGNDTVLRLQKPLASGDSLTVNTANINAVTFTREGFALSLPGSITLKLQDSTATPAYTRCLALTVVGAMTTQLHGTGSC